MKKIVYGILSVAGIGIVAATCTPSAVDGDPDGMGGTGGGNRGGGTGSDGSAGGSGSDGSSGGTGASQIVVFPDALIVTDVGTYRGHEFTPQDTLEACGATTFQIDRKPPEVMIVFDRSGSMIRTPAGCTIGQVDCPTMGQTAAAPNRWTIAVNALNSVLESTEDDIAWGMKMFPTCMSPGHNNADPTYRDGLGFIYRRCDLPMGTHDPCAVAGMETTPALSQYTSLRQAYTAAMPPLDTGATPTAPAIDRALQMLQATQSGRDKYLLVVTDGIPNCGVYTGTCPQGVDCAGMVVGRRYDALPGGTEPTEAVARAAAAGIQTFVVAFAITDTPTARDSLNAMAMAGGRALPDPMYRYYRADDQASLQAALSAIAAATISCTFSLDEPPPENSLARVVVNGNVVLDEDAQNGWSFGPGKNSIRFNGMACDNLKQGRYSRTDVTFSCPGEPLPEPPPPPE